MISALSFSENGAYLACGANAENCAIIKLENSFTLQTLPPQEESDHAKILQIHWLHYPENNIDKHFFGSLQLFGQNSEESNDNTASNAQNNEREQMSHEMKALSPHLLCILYENHQLTLYSFAHIPIWTIQIESLQSLILFKLSHENHYFINNVNQTPSQEEDIPYEFIDLSEKLNVLSKLSYFRWRIQSIISHAIQTLTTFSRKWKENLRVFIVKNDLMKNTLQNTYEIDMTTLQYWHSVVLCGNWHSASFNTICGQQWNEQSLQRLRSSMEMICILMLRTVQFEVMKELEECLMCCRYVTIVIIDRD